VASIVPVAFDDCVGWLHPAGGGRGVVLCSAFGYEELCSRRTMHDLAWALAQAGLSVLRFDYHGTADSAGGGEDPDRVATWIANIGAAIDLLRNQTGVTEVALVGLRLGALLATCAAARRDDISALALLAPPVSGHAYIRELKALAHLLVAPDEEASSYDGLEVAGFRVARKTLDSLAELDWPQRRIAGGPRVLLMHPGNAPAQPLAPRLNGFASRIEAAPFEAYARMMCDPTASIVPNAAVARLTYWLAANPPAAEAKPVTHQKSVLVGESYVEVPAMLGQAGRLTGIFCRSLSGHQPRKAIVFINAGAIYHIGWARMHVDMARELARSGIASLRFDLAGIGDSEAPPEGVPPLYSALTADIAAAIDWLEARGIREITVFGSCSGAYQAFHAAISDRRINRVALVNQLCFVWGPAYAVQLEAWRRTKATEVAARRDARNAAVSALSPRGLLARTIPPAKPLIKRVLRRATDLFVRGKLRWSGKNLVERWFEELSRRGTRVLLVYSDNDPGLAELERYMGPDGSRATAMPGVTKRLIEKADHTFTPSEARRRLRETVHAFLTEDTPKPAASARDADLARAAVGVPLV
jgi:pimeloyl-ACP methyl ester carboxylesterase